ncbi:MAG: type II toxin-antitoxin system Phd/YefM family antitoxin [bacterium]|nr:type II toxin-antitoxin system Phd/YefM family antitoxin [bacterium]
MKKTIAITELKTRCDAVIDEVAEEHVPYVLTRAEHPRAALVPYQDFLRFQALADDVHERFDRTRAAFRHRTADLGDEEVAADVEAALAEVRAR